MASFQRKLLPKEAQDTNTTTSSTTTTTVKTCLFFCSSQSNQTNPTFVCPEACLAICPSVCHYALEAFILPPEPSPPPNNPQNLSPLLISMLIILGSALFLITFYVLYTKLYSHFYNYSNSQIRYRRRRPSNTNANITNDEEHGPAAVFHPIWYIPTVGLNPSVINSITVCKYGRREKDRVHVEGSDCAVCLAEFQQGDELRVLPKCNHAFHIPCIDTWLRSHNNCPLCRAPVVVAPHDQTPQNSSSRLASSEDHSPAQNSSSMDSNMRRSASTDCVENNKGNGGGGSCGGCSSQSQRWSHLERGAASFVSRSLSCSANIFSSRYNHNHNHNNNHNNSNSINNINNNDDDNNNNNNNNNDNGERRGPNSY